ncbi:MAG TPA: preprotein translocase subunit SecA [Clostridiales bacterium]|nr:preprotein translocase subunit SecA [Clostridiales bacterium]
MGLFSKLFGNYSQKEVKRVEPIKDKVLALEAEYAAMTDEQLKAKTPEFKQRLANGETLEDILPEAFATCREASWRVLGMKHFPVQVVGGIILHQGRVAEMKTGEGKTLVATLPAYLNALTGKGVHIVTVNDYLARRDSEWMGKVYRFLGLTVGLVVHTELSNEAKREAYAADITYGTNNEMGFDYLRDNMVMYKEQRVQRGHVFAIVDEVDSILIDEARTPLIISGRGDKSTELYKVANDFVSRLKCVKVTELDTKMEAEDVAEDGDYLVDEKAKTASLTKSGIAKAEQFFGLDNLMDVDNLQIQHHLNQAVKAHGVMNRDDDYVVKDGEVLIVDEFTGRIMLGRRYSDGLHQAIEAKEHVNVRHETKTLATITFQNYFRLYKKLSGMTGTALTESDEFQEIYNLDCVEIPTNKPMIRLDNPDVLYKTTVAKYNAIIEQIKESNAKGQPVLVGTVSIEKSEELSKALKRAGIKHEVLNAKQHEREAEIVAQAGKWGSVTIATNMAGRGTDIILGGNAEYMAKADMRKMDISDELIAEATGFAETDDQEILDARRTFSELESKYKAELADEANAVREAGGLFIIGTERHESRRIDNQLRGRSGRQGDPGESRFYLSAEDDLLRLFAGDRFYNTLNMFGSAGDMPIENKMFTNAIESAQRKVEGNNFAIRKNVLKYDDVMNVQRGLVYDQRNMVLDGVDLTETINKMLIDNITNEVDFYCNGKQEDWDVKGLASRYPSLLPDGKLPEVKNKADLADKLIQFAQSILKQKEELYGKELFDKVKHKILLENVDLHWMEHIDEMDQLRNGIGLQAYAQHDPVVIFREESADRFEEMNQNILNGTVNMLLNVIIRTDKDVERRQKAQVTGTSGGSDGSEKARPIKKSNKVGRNELCPCGSGLKYKRCCGRNE